MKPKIKLFQELAAKHGGIISRIADELSVNRLTVYRWMEADTRFSEAIEEHRGRLLDRCIETASALANGIPIRDDDGEIIGWKERPDAWMLKYLISTLGRKEGFGESLDVTTKGESIRPEPLTIEVIDRREQVDESQV